MDDAFLTEPIVARDVPMWSPIVNGKGRIFVGTDSLIKSYDPSVRSRFLVNTQRPAGKLLSLDDSGISCFQDGSILQSLSLIGIESLIASALSRGGGVLACLIIGFDGRF